MEIIMPAIMMAYVGIAIGLIFGFKGILGQKLQEVEWMKEDMSWCYDEEISVWEEEDVGRFNAYFLGETTGLRTSPSIEEEIEEMELEELQAHMNRCEQLAEVAANGSDYPIIFRTLAALSHECVKNLYEDQFKLAA